MVDRPLSDDSVLRKYGFKIHARPKGGGATWERHGKVFFVNVALKIARREEAEEKKREEIQA